ncbi:MAG TPA: tyrosine-type recombinase/integrase [Candidatus Binatia bacterium]|nr:tyrosine-type recombinase/integrase [Candidatus Binatia bacterium]
MEAIDPVPDVRTFEPKLNGASPEILAMGYAFLDSKPLNSPTTRTRKAHFLNVHFKFFKNDSVNVTQDQMNAFLVWMRTEQKYRSAGIGKVKSNTMEFLRYLHSQGIRKEEPDFRKLTKIPQDQSRATAFSHADYLKLLDAAMSTETQFEYWPSAIIIGWNTGLRISDVTFLLWSSVDFENNVLRLKPMKLRHLGQSLEIPIEPELRTHLKFLWENRDPKKPYVLPSMAWQAEDHYRWQSAEFGQICKKAGLVGYSFKSFRHAFVTRLLNAGVDARVIGSITGQSVQTVYKYTRHVTLAAKVMALSKARQAMADARTVALNIELPS